jgi:hypothetical protein
MSIQEKCILTSFHTPHWDGKVRDKKATKFVHDEFLVKRKAGNFYKKVLQGQVDDIVSSISRARKFHNDNTLPYDRNGRSLLVNSNYFNYVQEMGKHKDIIYNKVEKLLENFERYIEKDMEELGNLFNIKDYPSKEEVKEKYKININFEPVPSGDNLFLNLETNEVNKIRGEIEKEVNERIENAVKELARRLYTVVSHLHEVLEGDGRVFESTVNNIKSMCELIPKLNVLDNPDIEAIGKECMIKLCYFSVDDLKEEGIIRKTVKTDAKELSERLKNYFG